MKNSDESKYRLLLNKTRESRKGLLEMLPQIPFYSGICSIFGRKLQALYEAR